LYDRALVQPKGLEKDNLVHNLIMKRNRRALVPAGIPPRPDYFGKDWNFKKVKNNPLNIKNPRI
jgi:hypothetical protein